jgi:hypothetical protein
LGGDGGDLLGATSHPAQHESDPIATQVLSRGDAIMAPRGRADDFSWPRADASAGSATDAMPAPAAAAPMPAPPPGKGAGKTDGNKSESGKSDAKKTSEAKSPAAANAAPNAAAAPAKPGRPTTTLDGAPPRPPLPVGLAGDNAHGGY